MELRIDNEVKIKLPLAKQVFDKLLALLLFVLTVPVGLIIALAIKFEGFIFPMNRGAVFHIEKRVSEGAPFDLYKFRILKQKPEIPNPDATRKAIENHPGNLTAVGKILKKFGLDEIPQLWNILNGDMSFVGPRPKPLPEYEALLARGFTYRKFIKAGLTGPAQIMKGTERLETDEYKADAGYVDMCLSLPGWRLVVVDLDIFVKTIGVMFKGTGE